MAHATAEFRLSTRQEDGATLRQHLMMAYEATGRLPEELADLPELPRNGVHLWAWFLDLHQTRGSAGFGPSPLSYRDLRDWCAMTGNRLEPWEVRAILRIDQAYLSAMADEMRKEARH